jgi:hypothetical protein
LRLGDLGLIGDKVASAIADFVVVGSKNLIQEGLLSEAKRLRGRATTSDYSSAPQIAADFLPSAVQKSGFSHRGPTSERND